MSGEGAAAGAGRGIDETGLCSVKLENPFITPEDQEGDADERPAKAGSWGSYRALQGGV